MESPLCQVLRACDFAAKKHENQRRKNTRKTPYINHPIGVALNVAVALRLEDPEKIDIDALIGALLHDTVEDTDTTLDEIEKHFTTAIRDIVAQVSDNKSLPKDERKRLQIEHAASACREAKLIKMADTLHNLRSFFLEGIPATWTPVRVQGYFVWKQAVMAECRDVNEILENQLQEIFRTGTFTHEGQMYDAIPKNTDLEAFLESYYEEMKKMED